jgi:hypothetical protein
MRRASALSGLVVLAVLSVVTGPAGATGVKKGTWGVLEVEYVLSGKGSQVVGGTDHSDWHVTRTLSFRVGLIAGDLQVQPVVLGGVGAQSATAKPGAALQKHQGSLNRLEAETAKCKHDKDCEARVTMDFMVSGEGAAVMGDMAQAAKAAQAAGPRYQRWSGLDAAGNPISASGTYKVDEYSKVVVYDPDCGRTNNLCTTVRQTKGAGNLVFPKLFSQELAFEGVVVDNEKGLLTVALPTPDTFSVDASEDVQSTRSGASSRKVAVRVLDTYQKSLQGKLGVADRAITVPLREERGETTLPLTGALGSNGTLTVRWRFALLP